MSDIPFIPTEYLNNRHVAKLYKEHIALMQDNTALRAEVEHLTEALERIERQGFDGSARIARAALAGEGKESPDV